MGRCKDQLLEYWCFLEKEENRAFEASYEECQSRLRLAMTARDVKGSDLRARLVSLVLRQSIPVEPPLLSRPKSEAGASKSADVELRSVPYAPAHVPIASDLARS